MPRLKFTSKLYLSLVLILLLSYEVSAFNPLTLRDNIESHNNQTAWSSRVANLEINRGPSKFICSDGELTLFDFGSGVPCALVFEGDINFVYTPPNELERYQLDRLYGKNKIDIKLSRIAIFYTVAIENIPDTLTIKRVKAPEDSWDALHKAYEYAFDYLGEYIPCKLLNDMLAECPGTYFIADLWRTRYDHLIFIEDHRFDDIYRLYKPRIAGGMKTYDVLGGYSPGNSSISTRGVIPIDITNYEIKSAIERGGDMTVDCRIHFKALESGRKFLDWQWYEKNKPLAAFGSDGDSLVIINRDDQWGMGVALNKSLIKGNIDYIDIKFECGAVQKYFGLYVLEGQTFWYPLPMPFDRATYDLRYECQKDYEVISCGRMIESETEGDVHRSRWLIETPVKYVSFNLGIFERKEFMEKSAPPVIVYLGENYRHDENTQLYAARYDNLSSANMLDMVGKDVSKSLQLFTEYFAPCPFDTVRVSEIPWGHGQGSPGLLHLSWYTFQFDDLIGSEERFRAHEVSHQWWGHIVENEHYRDTWLIEGMAELCGLMYLETVAEDRNTVEAVLQNWRREIIWGGEVRQISTDKLMAGVENYTTVVSDGTVAGPLVMGNRLDNSLSYDYQVITYTKGAYVLNMLRYLMHDYENNSDETFLVMLRDMLMSYAGKSINTEQFKALVEKHLDMDMTWFFDQWVYGIDIPTYEFDWETKKADNGEYLISCEVKQQDVPDGFKMPVTIGVFAEGNQTASIYNTIMVDKPEVKFELPSLKFKPTDVKFNLYDAVLCRIK